MFTENNFLLFSSSSPSFKDKAESTRTRARTTTFYGSRTVRGRSHAAVAFDTRSVNSITAQKNKTKKTKKRDTSCRGLAEQFGKPQGMSPIKKRSGGLSIDTLKQVVESSPIESLKNLRKYIRDVYVRQI